MNDYVTRQFAIASQFKTDQFRILSELFACQPTDIWDAEKTIEDTQHNTDAILPSGERIMLRVRDEKYLQYYGEVSFRAYCYRAESVHEWTKFFKQGWGDWMLYGFGTQGTLRHWMLVDLWTLRDEIRSRVLTPNRVTYPKGRYVCEMFLFDLLDGRSESVRATHTHPRPIPQRSAAVIEALKQAWLAGRNMGI